MTDNKCTHHATLATCYRWHNPFFEDGFFTSRKDGIGGGRQVSAQDAMHMAAAFAGCRTALVGIG